MNPLNLYVCGQKAFGAAAAERLAAAGHRIIGATSPATTSRGSYDLLAGYCLRTDTPWTDTARFTWRNIPPGTDLIVAAHSHAFVSRKARDRARIAAIGYHPSLLPLHRGRDAIRWTIRDHDRVTGGSVYHLTDRTDAGPIAAQSHALVPPGISVRELWRDLLFPLGLDLLETACNDAAADRLPALPQDEACATWEPSMDTAPLHRPDLPELPPATADRTPATARASGA